MAAFWAVMVKSLLDNQVGLFFFMFSLLFPLSIVCFGYRMGCYCYHWKMLVLLLLLLWVNVGEVVFGF